ncbi:hypothetical protein [Streptomyces violaceusniger]|uniref:hypothetical protein n=1 Tax=Streptomyces violaceusniger TaxID=68280 RepID=UPI00030BDD6C|nr:hypothetical protein [Streptomyces violaceusniger]
MRERATLQGIPLLAADLLPDLFELEASGLPLTLVGELHGLTDTGDRGILIILWFLPGAVS